MTKAKSNNSNKTARRAAKGSKGRKAGRSAKGSAARRPEKSAKTRSKDKKPRANNRKILETGATSTNNTKSTS